MRKFVNGDDQHRPPARGGASGHLWRGMAILLFFLGGAGCDGAQSVTEPRGKAVASAESRIQVTRQRDGGLEYIQLAGGKEGLDAINRTLKALAHEWECTDRGKSAISEASFSVTEHYLDDQIVSFHYEAMQFCDGMAGIESVDGGLALRLSDGKPVTLPDILPCLKEEAIHKKVLAAASKIPLKQNCPPPSYSGEFFLRGDKIIFLEFFPQHFDTRCEFTVTIPLSEFGCKTDSSVTKSRRNPG